MLMAGRQHALDKVCVLINQAHLMIQVYGIEVRLPNVGVASHV